MNYNHSKLEKLMSVMDVDFIAENPDKAYKLMQWMYAELNNRYDVIQIQRQKLLLTAAMKY